MVTKISIKETQPVKVYFVGDLHVGSKTFAKKEFEQLLDQIKKEKDSRIILMGDHGDFIEPDDTKRYDPHCIDPELSTATEQYHYVKNAFKPLKDKIYGILRGNHESAYAKYHKELFLDYRDFSEMLAKELDTKYLEDMGIIELKLNKKKYNLVVAHGAGNSPTLTGQIKGVLSLIEHFELTPNLAVIGHVHAAQTIVTARMNMDFKTRVKYLGLSGSFYRTYIKGNVNYASSSLYSPLPVGCIAYTFDGGEHLKDEKILFD